MAGLPEVDPAYSGLGPVEVGGVRCAPAALRLREPIPQHGQPAAFCALINPSGPVTRAVLEVMAGTGDYSPSAVDADRRGTTALRSGIGADSLAGPKANMGVR